MCGIIGCTLKLGEAAPLIHQGLKRLEYRGYDSAGIATINEGEIHLKKDYGKIDEIHEALNFDDMPGTIGVGHCLHPDTYILLSNGEVRKIRNLPRNIELLSYDFNNNKFVASRGKVFKHRANELLKIKTSSTEIECTKYHRFYVFDSERELVVEKSAKDIKKGDLLILTQEIKIVGRPLKLKEVPVRIYYKPTEEGWRLLDKLLEEEENRNKISKGFRDHIKARDRNVNLRVLKALGINPKETHFKPVNSATNYIKFPSTTSPKLMRLLGYYYGDGSSYKRGIKFKDGRLEILEEYKKLIKELFAVEGKISKEPTKNCYVLRINSIYLLRWMKKNFAEIIRKEFPSNIGKLTDEEVYAFIGGLYDAEGCINRRSRITYIGISDADAIRQIQMLLLRAGVLASISFGKLDATHKKRPVRLQIANEEYIGKFIEKIGRYISKYKLKQLSRLYNQLGEYAFKHIKIPIKRQVLYEKFRIRNIRGEGYPMEYAIRKYGNNKIIKYLEKYLNSPIIYQRVTDVREFEYEGYVYDIEVEKYHSFIANSTIQHNSRWATHGAPTKENAHPHSDCKGLVAVVHNGVIENFLELKKELIDKGHVFASKTDTEVIPHLIEEELARGEDLYGSVLATVRRLRGSYSIAVISSKEPNRIICARNESPLVIGVSEKGTFCASDIPAILPFTNRILSLRNGEIAILEPEGFEVRRIADESRVEREVKAIDWTIEMAEKQGYPHFMLKEIHEQPLSLRNALRLQEQYLELLATFLDRGREVFLVGAGTSYHACLAGSYMFSKLARLMTYPVIASEFIERYGDAVGIDSVVLTVSQSGETYDVLKAVEHARMRAATILGITNTVGSTLTRVARAYVVQQSGPEIGVAATKTFTSQLMVLAQLALLLAKRRGKISQDEIDELKEKLANMPKVIEEILRTKEEKVKQLAKKYAGERLFLFLGRGISTATTLEGRLKLLEITYIPSLAYPAGESKHGPISVIEDEVPVIFVCPKDGTRKEIVGNMMEMKARGAKIISICEEGDEEIAGLSDDYVEIPKGIPEILSPIPYIISLQLLAYYLAVERGLDPDRPRNLAKSVTVP